MKEENYKKIYYTYAPKLVAFATQYVINTEDAENIVQDVFMLLWEKWEVYGNHNNILAFLFLTVKNRCVDFLRHASHVDVWTIQEHEEYYLTLRCNMTALESFNDELATEEQIARRVSEALESLPPRCREIFIKNKLQGIKQKDIASQLGISVNTVESQMAIAYRILRENLHDLMPLLLFLIA